MPGQPAPYCLFHHAGETNLITGRIVRSRSLAAIPRPTSSSPVVSVVPYCLIRERGYEVHDGGEPILTLIAEHCERIDISDVIPTRLPDFHVRPVVYSLTDDEFAEVVDTIVQKEICNGEGSNFLISRIGKTHIGGFNDDVARVIFDRLVRNEPGAYYTFCFFDGERHFIGASPERHLTIRDDTVTMNPISGTMPKRNLTNKADLLDFLTDPKEINELFQVVDEELKMMAKICPEGGTIRGPFLKELSSVIHTEYLLEGTRSGDVLQAFHDSMFAATMIGSPLQNAARIIRDYESDSRRYYSSALLFHGIDINGKEFIDSPITIRTMEIDVGGDVRLQAGASIVRDSVPEKETQEVTAKVEGLLRSLHSAVPIDMQLANFVDDEVRSTLEARNTELSLFWMRPQTPNETTKSEQLNRSVLIIDNEDEFTFMFAHILHHLGCTSTVRRYDTPDILSGDHDLVIVGPGPGDPNSRSSHKMAIIRGIIDELLSGDRPFMAVCLGHQILSTQLGLEVVRIDPPLQGVQLEVDLFGKRERVGFYNTFFAQGSQCLRNDVEVSTDDNNNVIALSGPNFRSFQCHLESVLTRNGAAIIHDAVRSLF